MKVLWGLIFSLTRCLWFFWCYCLEIRIIRTKNACTESIIKNKIPPSKNTTSVYLKSTLWTTGLNTRPWQAHKVPRETVLQSNYCVYLWYKWDHHNKDLLQMIKLVWNSAPLQKSLSKHDMILRSTVVISQSNYKLNLTCQHGLVDKQASLLGHWTSSDVQQRQVSEKEVYNSTKSLASQAHWSVQQ